MQHAAIGPILDLQPQHVEQASHQRRRIEPPRRVEIIGDAKVVKRLSHPVGDVERRTERHDDVARRLAIHQQALHPPGNLFDLRMDAAGGDDRHPIERVDGRVSQRLELPIAPKQIPPQVPHRRPSRLLRVPLPLDLRPQLLNQQSPRRDSPREQIPPLPLPRLAG